jgi:protease II
MFHAFNFQNTIGAYRYELESDRDEKDYDYSQYTGEFHRKISCDLSYLKHRISGEDIVITSISKDNFLIEIEMNEYHYYYFIDDSNETREWVRTLVEEHDQGWIVLDETVRSDFSELAQMPENERTFGGKTVTLLVHNKSEKIFRWQQN